MLTKLGRLRLLRLVASLLLVASASGLGSVPARSTVRVQVLSLFHPRLLVLTARHTLLLHLAVGGTNLILNAGQQARVEAVARGLVVRVGESRAETESLTIDATKFTLAVPMKLERDYQGGLLLTGDAGVLQAVVTMDTETAVASIVAAESAPGANFEALKAQAVVSRSYLLAHPSHRTQGFDACDTTHCQWLRSPPAAGSLAAKATRATKDEVLVWGTEHRLVAAHFSLSCGGHTEATRARTASGGYTFRAVRCEGCLRHARARVGHGLGLCQAGAGDLASQGMGYRAILAHYFPATTVSLSSLAR